MNPLPPRRHAVASLVIMLGTFAIVAAIAGLAGAANLGTALSFGQMGFAVALVFVLVRR